MQTPKSSDRTPRRRSIRLTMNGLQDEMYRSMLRLEAGKEGAILSLCHALVTAWNAAGSVERPKEFENWLQKVT